MKRLICDYGEVLCTAPPAEDRTRLEEATGWSGPAEEFWAAYWRERPSYDRADVTAAQYWEAVLGRRLEEGRLAEVTAADTAGWLHPNVRSLEAAERLASKGVALALFSNAPVEVAAGIDAAPWLDAFSRRFFSCALRAVKPEPAAYEAVLADLGARPGEVVFVDDRPANVAGAEAAGITAVLFEGPGTFDSLPGL